MNPEKIVNEITKEVGSKFRTFGGGQEGFNNPIAAALKDEPFQFAAGVDVKSVVDYVWAAIIVKTKPKKT